MLHQTAMISWEVCPDEPPIRNKKHQIGLWHGIKDGVDVMDQIMLLYHLEKRSWPNTPSVPEFKQHYQ